MFLPHLPSIVIKLIMCLGKLRFVSTNWSWGGASREMQESIGKYSLWPMSCQSNISCQG